MILPSEAALLFFGQAEGERHCPCMEPPKTPPTKRGPCPLAEYAFPSNGIASAASCGQIIGIDSKLIGIDFKLI